MLESINDLSSANNSSVLQQGLSAGQAGALEATAVTIAVQVMNLLGPVMSIEDALSSMRIDQLKDRIVHAKGGSADCLALFLVGHEAELIDEQELRQLGNERLDICALESEPLTDKGVLLRLVQPGGLWARSTLKWEVDADSFDGVEFNDNGDVIKLELSKCGLSGQMPAVLGQFKQLEVLNLSGNQFSQQIPSEFGKLLQLEVLNLSNNQLSGKIPVEIGKLLKLKRLALGHNQLTGSIPSELGQLSKLKNLFLFWNKLSGDIPAALGQLLQLSLLDLSNNLLEGSIPSEFGQLAQLDNLHLNANARLLGEIPREIGQLFFLNIMNLIGTEVITEPLPLILQRRVDNGDLMLMR